MGFYGILWGILWGYQVIIVHPAGLCKELGHLATAVAWQFQSRNSHGFYQISTASNVGNPEITPTITINGWNRPSPNGFLFMTLALPHYCIHTVIYHMMLAI